MDVFIFFVPFMMFLIIFSSIVASLVKGHKQSEDSMQSMVEEISKQRTGEAELVNAQSAACEYCGSKMLSGDVKCKSCGAKIKNRK